MNIFNDFHQFYNNRKSTNWNFAKHYIPEFFESKFIVHWVYGIIENFPFDDYPLQKETFEEINKRVKIEQEFNVLLNNEKLYRPISIMDLANQFNVPFSNKTVNLIPETPGTCFLDNLTIFKLKESLKKLSEKSKLNLLIYDSEEYTNASNLQKEYIDIDLEKYFEIQGTYRFQLETCLFSENLDWCFTTSEEAPMLIGCKLEMESEIYQKMSLELFKVENNQAMY
ncbi:hypothetical protein FF125_06230 [Aureibaculum algae]|uniref:DUF2711 family protein n=1 Tax=Aureibaculum algae TaxID=2584122 RepID=A0A5B7TS89_9FLAO|nr:hypothetical protein [Aureibaculum algae]QCX38044.1 hypothetical protein FF125_06230 [Aureibaculum algae]